ncbi:MAG TPA: hypothetical protein PK992_14330 [Planctomycetaceae bacterium]|nr:hypothetical protein [Planctomycetaceae bacterium]
MGQSQPDERHATLANVDQLLDELQQLAKYAKPAEQSWQAGSSSVQALSIVATGR